MPKNPPTERKETIISQPIVEEMKNSYLDYAMSVIVARALPDVRDGLKPVHRRILYAMWDIGLKSSAKFRKSATVVGEVLGKYHPHGDAAVYDSLVRLAQNFSMRYPLIHGQGNFGCFTGDTKVKITDGSNLTFKQLLKEHKQGKIHYTYTFNHKTNEIEIAKIVKPRLTKRNVELIKITLDNGETIRCTLNHKFMIRDGSYKEARFLEIGNSLMPCATRLSTKKDDPNVVGYTMLYQPYTQKWSWAHRLADQWNLKHSIYQKNAGRIRHHKNFDKLNNNPDNIIRIKWKDHWKLHAKLSSWRHKNDPKYVEKLKIGREKYLKNNHELLSKRRKEMNKELWQDEQFRKNHHKRITDMWKDTTYKECMRKISSENLKKLWSKKSFRDLLSTIKSKELKERWGYPAYRAYWRKKTKEISSKIWQSEEHRQYISELSKQRTNEPEWKEEQSKISKALWNNADYRAKYPKNHFKKMAQKLWENPATRLYHSRKAKYQWKDENFKTAIINSIKKNNARRLKSDPEMMRELTEKAKDSLKKKWRDSAYKNAVIKSKILGYVHNLLQKHETISSHLYERERSNNCIPRLENALKYFGSFDEIIESASLYNHTVVAVELLKGKEDVYDLTINETHNFLLSAGVFVHNSVDGDAAAAMRYTEAKLNKITDEMLTDIAKETVAFKDNYDGSHKEPVVLPSKLPNLLLNGTLGIAVGMATNIPPHNLSELCDGIAHLIKNPESTVDDLMRFIKGPDFPTGGAIFDITEIKRAYATGKGSIVMRAKCRIIEANNGYTITVDELPYQVNKAQLIEKIAELVKEGRIKGIRGLRDESDRVGMRISIELKKDSFPKKVLNQLYKYTRLQDTFHVNMLALVDGIQPRVLSLKMVLEEFIKHRQIVIRRRTEFDLKNARDREHILIGLTRALENIDAIIETIKKSADRDIAKLNLIKTFQLSLQQSEAILQMRLQALAGLERLKVEKELEEKRALIKELEQILKNSKRILTIIGEEIAAIKNAYGDERKTEVVQGGVGLFSQEDLIPKEAAVIMITKDGYIKRISPQSFKAQGRGGKGVIALSRKEEDTVLHMVSADTHDNLLFFTNSGKVFQLKAYEVPDASRVAKGNAVVNFLELDQNETVTALLPVSAAYAGAFYVMATQHGVIKKVDSAAFAKVRRSGLIAITIKDHDILKWVKISNGKSHIMLTTAFGLAIRFKEGQLRGLSRGAQGVFGIKLKKKDFVVGMDVIDTEKKDDFVLSISENGYGKMTHLKEYKVQSRAGKGIKTLKVTAKTGPLTSAEVISPTSLPEDAKGDLIIISEHGQIIRISLSSIPRLGRATQGVRLMRFKNPKDRISQVTIV